MTVQFGKNLPTSRFPSDSQGHILEALSHNLGPDEKVHFVARSFDMGHHFFVVTNARVLAFDPTLSTMRLEIWGDQIRSGVVHDFLPSWLRIMIIPGNLIRIRFVHEEDVALAIAAINDLRHYLSEGKIATPPAGTEVFNDVWSEDTRLHKVAMKAVKQRGLWREWKAEAAEESRAELRDRQTVQKTAASDASYGREVCSEIFAYKRVRIYEHGFVRVSGWLLGAEDAPFERLIGIEDDDSVSKKSAAGRGAGAVLTGGASWLLTSDKRGDVYLTIVTDRTTHLLHEDPPTAAGLQNSKKLAVTGRAILAQRDSAQSPVEPARDDNAPQSGSRDISERLRQLEGLHAEGLISEDEFKGLRTSLLSEL